jgi:hypothetical protein
VKDVETRRRKEKSEDVEASPGTISGTRERWLGRWVRRGSFTDTLWSEVVLAKDRATAGASEQRSGIVRSGARGLPPWASGGLAAEAEAQELS